jgi:hypothetical protein
VRIDLGAVAAMSVLVTPKAARQKTALRSIGSYSAYPASGALFAAAWRCSRDLRAKM